MMVKTRMVGKRPEGQTLRSFLGRTKASELGIVCSMGLASAAYSHNYHPHDHDHHRDHHFDHDYDNQIIKIITM